MSLPEPYYDHAGIRIFLGDCREILPGLPAGSVDLVLTDPPYGVGHTASAPDGYGATWDGQDIAGDADVSLRDSVLEPYQDVAAFGVARRSMLPRAHTVIVWDKGPAAGGMNFHAPWRMNFELIFIRGHAFKGGMDLGVIVGHWIPTWESRGKSHQHQKPVSLMKYLLRKAPDAHTILDPFMGSGTTLVAAKQLGRRAVGIEIELKYVEIAVRRLSQEVLPFNEIQQREEPLQLSVFDGVATPADGEQVP